MAYRNDIDLLKGISIIAVVLYHMGLCKSGYLGVDVFFVINGFLILPKMVNDIDRGNFNYFSFLFRRVCRLFPMIVIVTAISLFIGRFWGMFPNDYKRLCESVIASSFMSENILSAVTEKDYWSTINDYKPLMHLWYIGILFEFYIVMPVLLYGWKLISRIGGWHNTGRFFLLIITCISIILYFMPGVTEGNRFYYLPFRLFELTMGGLAGLSFLSSMKLNTKGSYYFALTILVVLVFWGTVSVNQTTDIDIVSGRFVNSDSLIPKSMVLVIVVALTSIVLIKNYSLDWWGFNNIQVVGRMSYSIFIWHQFILAFYRYYFSSTITLQFILVFVFFCAILSYITYRYIEKISLKYSQIAFFSLILFVTMFFAYRGYSCAGIIDDVPELDVLKSDAKKDMFAAYVDRINKYDVDFHNNNNNINVLVIGNSFSRDWANLLLESKYKNEINLSYMSTLNDSKRKRINESDVIFYFGYKHELPDWFWKEKPTNTKVWGIGTKSYGICNGVIYKNRNKTWYHQQTVDFNTNYDIVNSNLKKEWADTYIDLIGIHRNKDGKIPAFTPDNKYISPDCRHWTKEGAAYFATLVNLDEMLGSLRRDD